MKVCHLTSVHNSHDTRILLKECVSLAKNGYDVSLIAPNAKDEVFMGVTIIGIKNAPASRLGRMTITVLRTLVKAIKQRAKIYHFHDPELIIAGLVLKLTGKKVIFDIHENISEQIKSKDWLPFRNIVSAVFKFFDFISAKCFYLILAENSYTAIYSRYSTNFCVALNMPDLSLLNAYNNSKRGSNLNELIYVGGVTKDRGIILILEALQLLKQENVEFIFHCIGPYEESLMDEVKTLECYKSIQAQVIFYSRLNLNEAYSIAVKCKAGLSILKPIPNYQRSYSTKIFEYMAVSLPVITSDFELYRNVVEINNCGICVNPLDPEEIAGAIKHLLMDNKMVEEMGENGRKAVEEKYNWQTESRKLVSFYKKLK